MQQLNVTQLIDASPISRLQFRVFVLCALVYFLDGIDYQVIGIASPLITREFAIARSWLGWVFCAGTLGAACGAMLCGLIAEKIGPRKTLTATTLAFGFSTLATAGMHGLGSLVALRVFTGFGLGGAVPCFVGMASEYAPRRRRATIVTLVLAAFPLGATIGAFANAYIIRHGQWRDLFYIWGATPILLACILAVWLPESIRFALAHDADTRRLARIVLKISKQVINADTSFTVTEQQVSGLLLKQLFIEGRIRGTFSLWGSIFLVYGVLVVMSTWTPALITPLGFSPSQAAIVVALNGFGVFFGTCVAGRLLERFGVARIMIPGFVLASVTVALYAIAGQGTIAILSTASFVAGLFLGLTQSGIMLLSALIYPVAVRSTGVGCTMGVGRFGATIMPLIVGAMVALRLGAQQIFLVMGALLLLAVPCIWVLVIYQRRDRDTPSSTPGVSISRVAHINSN
jgi:MFS transporter, AAHS family, 4-hydroxybenzoate transporter